MENRIAMPTRIRNSAAGFLAGIILSLLAFGLTACAANLTDEVKPYLEYLGGSTSSSEITLPKDLYDDRNTVSFAGMEGSVEMGQSMGGYFMHKQEVDELTWTSNNKVTHEEFEGFKKNIDKYYGFEAEEVEVLGKPSYRWEGDDVGCMVTASYDNGHAKVEFQI